jgi:SlyX protein
MDLAEQVVELQMRIAYQEDALEQLSDVIAKQDIDIIQLKQQIRLLIQRVEDVARLPGEEGGVIVDERPPHY